MAGTTGLEPAASAVTGQRSNQLNYVPTRHIGKMENHIYVKLAPIRTGRSEWTGQRALLSAKPIRLASFLTRMIANLILTQQTHSQTTASLARKVLTSPERLLHRPCCESSCTARYA